jgi:calcium-dependent protein kinase
MSDKEQKIMLKTFKELDKNGDGTLSKDELLEGLLKLNFDEAHATLMMDKIFDELDVNNSDKIDFIEFVTAATDFQTNLSKKRVK